MRSPPRLAAYEVSERMLTPAAITRTIPRAMTDDPEQFAELVREHQAMVFSMACRYLRNRALAEEIAQDVFLQLYKKLPDLESPDHVLHWLRWVTAHRLIDHSRQQQRRPQTPLDDAPEPAAPANQGDPLLADTLATGVRAAGKRAPGDDPALSGRFGSHGYRAGAGNASGHREEPLAKIAGAAARSFNPQKGSWDMNLDDELKSALRREDPPAGFAQRVTARAQSRPARNPGMLRMIWAAGIAAMLVIGVTSVSQYRQVQGERAAREAVTALRIAADKLNLTRDKVLKLEN